MLVTQSCQTVWDPTDCGPPDSSVHGILWASILEWVAISFSRESSRPRDWTYVSCITGGCFTTGHQRSPKQHVFFFFFFFNMDTQRKHLLKQGNAKFSSTIFKKWWKESSLTFFSDGTKLLWLLEIVVNTCILYLEMKPLSQTQARVSCNAMVLRLRYD